MKLYILCFLAALACISALPADSKGRSESIYDTVMTYPEKAIDAGRNLARSFDRMTGGASGGFGLPGMPSLPEMPGMPSLPEMPGMPGLLGSSSNSTSSASSSNPLNMFSKLLPGFGSQ